MKEKKLMIIYCCVSIIVTTLLSFFLGFNIYATSLYIDGVSYEMSDETGYDISSISSKNTLCYGAKSIGKLSVIGELELHKSYNGFKAYGISDNLKLSYIYNGEYHSDEKDEWNISDSNEKTVNGAGLKKKVRDGAIVVQTSKDGKNWTTASQKTDVFTKKASDINEFCTIETDFVRDGMYYRIMVAYNMSKTRSDKKFWEKDEEKSFLEVYDFYVCYNNNPIILRDIETGQNLTANQRKVSKGFIIDKAGTDYEVSVTKDNDKPLIASDQDSFTQEGKYVISVKSNLGKEYNEIVTITDGILLTEVLPLVYDGGKDDEYEMTNKITDNTVYGLSSLTSLKIATSADTKPKYNRTDDTHQFGINGSSVGLYLRIANSDKQNGYSVNADTWGKKEKQKICDVYTGTVNSGALIIQKSIDGNEWTVIDSDKYSNGLYTTDYYKHYSNRGDVLVYTPSGQDVINGVFLRVIYAYQMKSEEEKKTDRFIEVYSLYLCNNNLDAVTIHNLSSQGKIADTIGEDDKADIELYKYSETLLSGSGTATGFSIDTSKNKKVKISVFCNGKKVDVSGNMEFKTNGKYDITLESAMGDKKNIVIYVDTSSCEKSMKDYFPNGFINGKRIYSEGEYPTYEGGLTNYSIPAIDNCFLSVSGEIINETTGNIITINSSRNEKNGVLEEAGHYKAVFTTRPKQNGIDLPGDYRIFTFQFDLIANGTAPGPVVNKEKLNDYCKTNMCDSYPRYYGLIYPSASTGNITLAFATREAAEKYAYNYQKGTVEKQDDGTFRYTGSFMVGQKEIYKDNWDLTDAMNFFAEQAVQELYFDMSDLFTYRTLSEETINQIENLRTLELSQSVTIFADNNQRDELCENDGLPVINDKKYAELSKDKNGETQNGFVEFCFIKDKYGYDSDSVIITDKNGKEYIIEYQKSVGSQLTEQNCPSGEITITEMTKYGDSTSYKAIYIAENDNTAHLTLSYYSDGREQKKEFQKSDENTELHCDAFRIEQLSDELDQFSIVTVTHSNEKKYHVADCEPKYAWSEQGEYTVSVVNRMGYSYSFKVVIDESDYATIVFSGYGTENLKNAITTYGTVNYSLPKIERNGYDLTGFEDEQGTIYSDEIANILFRGTKTLKAVWKAKEVNLHFMDSNGNTIIDSMQLNYDDKYPVSNLPVPQLTSQLNFDGWMMNGNLLSDEFITVDTENDIILVAAVSETDVVSEITDKAIKQNEDKKVSPIIFILPIISIIAISFIVFKKRGGSDDKQRNKKT